MNNGSGSATATELGALNSGGGGALGAGGRDGGGPDKGGGGDRGARGGANAPNPAPAGGDIVEFVLFRRIGFAAELKRVVKQTCDLLES